jgi:hypothetical protein
MVEMSALRELDHASIDNVLNHRSQYRIPNFGGSWRSQGRIINDQIRKNCHDLCDVLLSQKDYKLTISVDWGYFYTNDLSDIRRLEQLSFVTPLQLKQALLDHPRGTLVIRNSKHELRSYFKAGRITDQEKNNLHNFLSNQSDIRLSPALKDFFRRSNTYHYVNDNFFIDHDGTGLLTMLGLVRHQCIRKTVKLLRDK